MAVTIVTTVGASTANSYVSQAQATTYFEGHLNADDWTNASSDDKNRALVSAAARLQREKYEGSRTDEDQALAWPRYSATDADGWNYEDDEIPQVVKDAQCELALFMLGDDRLTSESGFSQFSSVSVGPVSATIRSDVKDGKLPEYIRQILQDVLLNNPGQVTLERG